MSDGIDNSGSHTLSAAAHATEQGRRDWKRAALWLVLLGPFFFASYGFANWLASQHDHVPSIVFAWETHIPFVPWTILPYWVIDLLYALSLFICATRQELDAHGKRLLTAQIVAVGCFILFPLRFSFERPVTSGVSGDLFNALSSFDQPFNQAPSLHIALLVLLWVLYVRHLPRPLIWPFHVLCALILLSVLTTFQHHFFDIPTGALLGWLCVWLWPLDDKPPFFQARLNRDKRAWRIASYYLVATGVFSLLAVAVGGVALWLFWPALSLMLVALNYVYLGSRGFQKDHGGRLSLAAKWLYWPYLLGAKINSRLWTRNQAKSMAICDGVHIGRVPSLNDTLKAGYHAVIDLSAEFDKPDAGLVWQALPSLDLLVPAKEHLLKAAAIIGDLRTQGDVLVVCALGYSRSALAIAAWLLVSKRAASVDGAIEILREKRQSIVISDEARQVLSSLL